MDRSYAQHRRSWPAWAFSNSLRLIVWYLIITVAFRCPSAPSELSPDSPRACAAYFDARDRVRPVAQPYYDAYLSHHVALVRPYCDSFDKKVFTPVYGFTLASYNKFAAPQVRYAAAAGKTQWKRSVKPQLDKAQLGALAAYDKTLGPHVAKVHKALQPHLDTAGEVITEQYRSVLLPTFELVQPYMQTAYEQGYHYSTEVGLPYSYWAANTAIAFVQKTLWPPVRLLYGENIQPQLAKIQERLASYQDGKNLESVVESVDAAMSSSIASSYTYSSSSAADSTEPARPSPPRKSSPPYVEDYTAELKAWKEKFSRAADRGAADLRARISTIIDNQVDQQVRGTGRALLHTLDETTHMALEDFKPEVMQIIGALMKHLDEDNLTDDHVSAAMEKTKDAVRSAGKRIKEAAQRLRQWRQAYNRHTEDLVNAATSSTLEVVNNIRDLGLQEIGMRWATLDGVSYKDWSEYHDMKRTFADWRDIVQKVVDSHEGPNFANAAGEELESRGMNIAENAAKELARLKDVALWKVEAQDGGADFSNRYTPPGAVKMVRRARRNVAGSEVSSQDVVHSIMSEASSLVQPAAESASSLAGDVSEAMKDAAGVPAASSAFLKAARGAGSASESFASTVLAQASSASSASKFRDQSSEASMTASSAASAASSAPSKASSAASSLLLGGSKPLSKISSSASSLISGESDPLSRVSSAAASASSGFSSAASSVVTGDSTASISSNIASVASHASKKVASGASSLSSQASASAASASYEATSTLKDASRNAGLQANSIREGDNGAGPSMKSAASVALSAYDSAKTGKSSSSRTSELKSSATQAASDASKKASDAVDSAGKAAAEASSIIASKVAEAGEKYTDVTSKLEL